MGHYIKVERPDKSDKIYKSLITEAEQIGLKKSFALILADFIYSQSLKDPE